MLFTVSTTHAPATDLGYLLHKHPDKHQVFDLPFGKAHVFYPEASPARCTAALQLEIDPIGLVRNFKAGGKQRLLEHYVNDRPYAASSFFSVALNKVFRSALSGRCPARQELADSKLPLQATIHCLPSPGGEPLLRRLFEPLGYAVETTSFPLDAKHPAWGDSPYFRVTIRGNERLCNLLRHLYVLVPVLDREKHYWVGDDEVEKLLRHGEHWLQAHPEKELIASRYLKSQRSLARLALQRLAGDDGFGGSGDQRRQDREQSLEAPLRLGELRLQAITEVLREQDPGSVVDLGCGAGKLLEQLLKLRRIEKIVGMDVSSASLEIAERRLRLADMPDRQRRRIALVNGSLTYRDSRLCGFDAAEVIEHIDPDRIEAFERAVFEFARPAMVIVTTPNSEYNAAFAGMKPGSFRHPDHRFEWNRSEFGDWARRVCDRNNYRARITGIGDEHPAFGTPTQMAIFSVADAGNPCSVP